MKRLLFGILALSICFTSCKKSESGLPDIDKAKITAEWTVSTTSVSIKKIEIPKVGDLFEPYRVKMEDTLKQLFRVGDKCLFKNDGNVTIRQTTKPYTVEGHYIIFDNLVKFSAELGNENSKLTLNCGDGEIPFMVKKYLDSDPNFRAKIVELLGGTDAASAFSNEYISTLVQGEFKVVLTKETK